MSPRGLVTATWRRREHSVLEPPAIVTRGSPGCHDPRATVPARLGPGANVVERDWLGGMNWRIAGPAAVLQMNYLRKTFLDVQPARHVMMANVQTVW